MTDAGRHAFPEPVDPWPDAPTVPFGVHDGHTSPLGFGPTPTPQAGKRPPTWYTGEPGELFGFVYEIVLPGQADAEHVYIGKTEGQHESDIVARLREHTRPAEVARCAWKAGIVVGKRGYRILERVYSKGHGYLADDAALRRAEADWIDRRRPTENRVRPVRPRATGTPLPRRRASRPTSPRRQPRRRRNAADRRARRNGWTFLVLVVLLTTLSALRLHASGVTGGTLWAASPMLGTGGAWFLFITARRTVRRITRSRR